MDIVIVIRQPPMDIIAPVPAAARPLSPRYDCTLSAATSLRVHTQQSAADTNVGGETAKRGCGGDCGSRLPRDWDNARRNQWERQTAWTNDNARRICS